MTEQLFKTLGLNPEERVLVARATNDMLGRVDGNPRRRRLVRALAALLLLIDAGEAAP